MGSLWSSRDDLEPPRGTPRAQIRKRIKKIEKVTSRPPPRGQVGSPFWHIFAAKSPINGNKHEEMSSKNAPRKRSPSRRVQSVVFDYRYTVSAVFFWGPGLPTWSQNGGQNGAEWHPKGPSGLQNQFFEGGKSMQQNTLKKKRGKFSTPTKKVYYTNKNDESYLFH